MPRLFCFRAFIGLLLLLLVPTTTYASPTSPNPFSGDDVYSLKVRSFDGLPDVFTNLSNRLMLGVFGKDALISFLGESIDTSTRSELEGLNHSLVIEYSKPFDGNTSQIIKAVIYSLYILVSLYFSSLIARYFIERAYSSQDEDSAGKSMGTSLYMMLMRAAVGLVVVVPFGGIVADVADGDDLNDSPVYSGLHLFMFKSFGLAFRVADQISEEYNASSSKFSPMYQIPFPQIYKNEMRQLIDFGMCLQTETFGDDVSELKLDINQNTDSVTVNAKTPWCSLDLSIPVNRFLSLSVDDSVFLKGSLHKDFNQLQMDAYKKIISQVVGDAIMFTSLSAPVLRGKKPILEPLDVNVNMTDWYEKCDIPVDDRASLVNSWPSYVVEREKLSHCLSKNMVEYLSYPVSSDGDIDTLTASGELRLIGRQKAICSPLTGTVGAAAGIDKDYLRNCVVKTCNKVNLMGDRLGLFECAAAVDSVISSGTTNALNERGFLMNSLARLSHTTSDTISSSSKSPVNDLSIEVHLTPDPEYVGDIHRHPTSNSLDRDGHILVSLAGVQAGRKTQNKKFVEGFRSTMLWSGGNSRGNLSVATLGIPEWMSDPSQIGFFDQQIARQDTFGRLGECLTHPNEMTEYGRCGSVTQEFSRLGVKAVSFLVLVSAGKGVSGLIKDKSDDSNDASLAGSKGKKKNASKSLVSVGMKRFVALASAPLMALIYDSVTVSKNDFFGGSTTDAILVSSTLALSLGFILQREEDGGIKHLGLRYIWGAIRGGIVYVAIVSIIVIPLLPIAFLLILFITALAAIISLFVASQFILIAILVNTDDGSPSDKLKKAASRFLVAFIRIPLIVMGYYLSVHMIDIVIPDFVKTVQINNILMSSIGSIGGGIVGAVTALFSIAAIVTICGILIYSCMDIIKQLYSISRMLIMGDKSNDDAGSASNMVSEAKGFMSK